MGSSVMATICYGIPLEEEELPWGDELESWWTYEVNKFTPTKDLYNAEGERIEGTTQEDFDLYYAEMRKAASGLPVYIERVGHYESASYVLAVPGLGFTQSTEWTPELITPFSESDTSEKITRLAAFRKFVAEYVPKELLAGEEGWYLVPFYG